MTQPRCEATSEAMEVEWIQRLQGMAASLPSQSHFDPPTGGPIRMCTGFQLPGLIEPVMANYPFAYHTNSTRWTPPGLDGRVFAIQCEGKRMVRVEIDDINTTNPAAPCIDCRKLVTNLDLSGVIERACDDTRARRRGMRNSDLTMSQLADRSNMHKERESLYRVTLYNKVGYAQICTPPLICASIR